jgi:hypothetical protein
MRAPFLLSWLLVGSADPYSVLAGRRLKPDVGTRRHESNLPVTQEKASHAERSYSRSVESLPQDEAVFTLSGVPPSEPAGTPIGMNPAFRARLVIDSFSLGYPGSPLKDTGQA